MIATRLALVSLVALASCAALRNDPAPTCDGRQRRPANPYGSVLQSSAASPSNTPLAPPTRFPSCP